MKTLKSLEHSKVLFQIICQGVFQNIWNIFARKIFYFLIFVTAFLIWILTTESGLRASFTMLKTFSPYRLTAKTIEGQWIKEVTIKDLQYQTPRYTLDVAELTLQWQVHALLNKWVKLPVVEVKSALLQFPKALDPLYINRLSGYFIFTTQFKPVKIQIQNLSGHWKDQPLVCQGGFAVENINGKNQVQLFNSEILLGQSKLTLSRSNQHAPINWHLLLRFNKDFQAESQGVLKESPEILKNNQDNSQNNTSKTWTGKILSFEIQSPIFGDWQQHTPVNMNFSSQYFSSEPLILQNKNIKAQAQLTLDWALTNALNIGLDIPHLPLKHPNLLGNASLQLKISQKTHQAPDASGQFTLHPGTIILKQNKREHLLPYLGGNASFSLKNKQFELNFNLKENIQNFLSGNLSLNPFTFSRRLWEQNLNGNISATLGDLKLFNLLFPQISHLKAAIQMDGTFLGTLKNPKLEVSAKSSNTRFSIPKQQIQVENLNLSLQGTLPEALVWTGQGFLGKGAFQLTGHSQLAKEYKTVLNIRGKGLQIYNTANIQILADPEITVEHIHPILFVKGSVQIPFANIELQNELKRANPSKDVVLINESLVINANAGNSLERNIFSNAKTAKTAAEMQGLRIVPNFYLILDKDVRFKGYSLDGFIGGKLEIDERPDGLLAGTGRLTIREGKYRLQGSTRYIHHGRLLFPPGTLLNNPILDIFISEKRHPELKDDPEISLYVQGTLQKPMAEFYSNVTARNAEILSRLYSTEHHSSSTLKQSQLLSNPASLLAGGANPFLERLQTNLGIEDFSFESREKPASFFAAPKEINDTHKTIFTQGGTDPYLVLGKSLTETLYLQFLQSVAITKPVTAIRLKYFLYPGFTASIETGTAEDVGGDLTFSMERD